jgi:Ca2+-binding EF-hand superfamily protein
MKMLCTESHLTELFAIFDSDGNGEVGVDEFKHIIIGEKIGSDVGLDREEKKRLDIVWMNVAKDMGITKDTKTINTKKFFDNIFSAVHSC